MVPLDTLRHYTGAPSGPENDALLMQMRDAAVAQVSAHTGWYLGVVAERVEEIPGTSSYSLPLSTPPASITSVAVLPYPGGNPEVLAASDYRFTPGESRLVRLGGYPWYGTLLYRVTYQAGYAEGEAPAQIALAVQQLVSVAWNRRGSEDVTSESVAGTYSYTRDPKVMGVLNALPRRIRV